MTLDEIDDTTELTQEQIMAMVAAAQARKSKMVALLIAIGAHLVLIGALVYVVFGEPFAQEPSLIIAAPHSAEEQLEPTKKELFHVKADRPAAPSASMSKVLVSETLSPVVVPVVDEFVENPVDLGVGFGEGMGTGIGSGGAGLGGSFFGTPAAGKSVLLVIDTSGSMIGNCGARGIEAIREEVNRTINRFRPGSRFNIICFANMADGFRSKPVAATSANKKAAIEFMEIYYTNAITKTRAQSNVDPKKPVRFVPIRPSDHKDTADTSGGSRYDMALIQAFEQHPDTIFLLTDGQPSVQLKGKSLSDRDILSLVRRAAKRAGGKRPVINGISVNGIGKSFLEDVAKAFRGTVKVIEPKKL